MTVIIDLRGKSKRTAAPRPEAPDRLRTCRYIGPPTGEMVECESCRGRTRLFVFGCEKFGTTTSKQCGECLEYKPKDEVK